MTTPRRVSLFAFVTTVAVAAEVAAQAPAPAAEQASPVPMQPVAPVPGAPVYVQPGYTQPAYAQPGNPQYYAPGYAPPGYAPPGYYPPGYTPPGYVSPGYVPPGYVPRRRGKVPQLNPDDPPPGYHTESRPRSGLLVGGGVMFGVSYAISVITGVSALTAGDSGYQPLFIPVAGPFVALASTHVFVGTSDGLREAGKVLGAVGLMFDGLLQFTGATMFVVGLAVPRDVVVRDSPAGVPDVSFGPGGATARWAF